MRKQNFRGVGVWDVEDRQEVFKPSEKNWGFLEFSKMPTRLQERFGRFRNTQDMFFKMNSFQWQTKPYFGA